MASHSVFTDLVDVELDPPDVVGLVAYSLYKVDKIRWVNRFVEQEHREPSAEEVERQYIAFVSLRYPQFRADAEVVLNELMDRVTSAEINRLSAALHEDTVIQHVDQVLAATEQRLKDHAARVEGIINPTLLVRLKGWIVQTVVVGLITAGLASLLFLVVWASALRDDPAMKKAVNDKVAQTVQEQLGTQ